MSVSVTTNTKGPKPTQTFLYFGRNRGVFQVAENIDPNQLEIDMDDPTTFPRRSE